MPGKNLSTNLPDNIDTEIKTLQIGHAKESARHDLLDQVPAEVEVLQGSQGFQVHVRHRLKKIPLKQKPWVQQTLEQSYQFLQMFV